MKSAAARFRVLPAFDGIEDLLTNSDVDAVSVASPIALDYRHCRLALVAGRHVDVIKTLTTTVAEADELMETRARGQEQRIAASPGTQRRCRPQSGLGDSGPQTEPVSTQLAAQPPREAQPSPHNSRPRGSHGRVPHRRPHLALAGAAAQKGRSIQGPQ